MKTSTNISLSENGEFCLACLLFVYTTVSLRFAEYPLWLSPSLFVNGEHIMATHDAYVWLAGVEWIGNFIGDPFTIMLRFLHEISGLPASSIGFWTPIIFIPVLAIPICLLARSLHLPEGGLVFGILATSGLGFLVRTRLGFCDTDVVNLLFPVSAVCALALWLSVMGGEEGRTGSSNARIRFAWAALVGVLGKLSVYVYPGSSSIILPALGLSVVIGLMRVNKEDRLLFCHGFLLVFALIFGGWGGSGLAVAWVALVATRQDLSVRAQITGILVVAIVAMALGNFREILEALVYRLYLYAKVGTPDMVNNATGIQLPDIARSVREAQNVEWEAIGPRIGGNWGIFVLGMLGFVLVSWRKPALLVFLPFLGLGLASLKFGNRFAMYGTVGIGAGLGLGLSEFMIMLRQSQGRRWIVQLAVACVVLWPSADFMQEVSPVPVLPQAYAQTFVDLGQVAEPDALLWQWWDYGYAGQYYAKRATFGDGSRHDGGILYPLARVHTTDSSHQARQMMLYFGQEVLESGLRQTSDRRAALLAGDPLGKLREMSARGAQNFVAEMALTSANSTVGVPSYLVVSWENLRLSGWISYYGNWDIVTGTSSPGKLQQVRGEVRIDSAGGSMLVDGQGHLIDTLDVIDAKGTRHFEWANGAGAHALINPASQQVFLMDSKMYNSMMVQMLIAPPEKFADDFTLVIDRYPWVRAYKVKG